VIINPDLYVLLRLMLILILSISVADLFVIRVGLNIVGIVRLAAKWD
jgi:hypothetical protein